MTTQELKQVILENIKDIYHKKYIGKISIQSFPKGYSIKLGMNNDSAPITIYAELEDEQFLKFLKQELRDRRFNLLWFGELNLEYPYNCTKPDTRCGCHDER